MMMRMDATIAYRNERDARTDRLLRDCLLLGTPERRLPARVRLEQAIGKDLTRLLLTSLTARSTRSSTL
jgi:hypothetical protein